MTYPAYYEPTNDLNWLKNNKILLNKAACSLEFDDKKQLETIKNLDKATYLWVSAVKKNPMLKKNGWFDNVDAEILFKWMCVYRPKQVFEVGCGYSSMVISESGVATSRILIEPYV